VFLTERRFNDGLNLVSQANKQPDIKNVVRLMNRQFSGLSLPFRFELDLSTPTRVKVSIARVDLDKVHRCAEFFGYESPADYRRQFEEEINRGLVELGFFKDFPKVSFVDLASVEEHALPKIMSLPKSVIRKKFSKTIDSNSWLQSVFRSLDGSW